MMRHALVCLLLAAGAGGAMAQDVLEEAIGRTQINWRRAQLGLPPLAHSAELAAAARGHAQWLSRHNQHGHEENPALSPGFHGRHFPERLANAGYEPLLAGAEVISFGPASAADAVESLMGAIYHRFGLLGTIVSEQGVAFARGHPTYQRVLVANLASRSPAGAEPPPDWTGVYPHPGQSHVPVDFLTGGEVPDPVPGSNRAGFPVSFHVQDARQLTVDSFTVTAAPGAPLQGIVLSGSRDASPRDEHTPASAAAFVPRAALAHGTTYTASFSGLSDGVPVARSWSFTTVAAEITLAPAAILVAPGGTTLVHISGGSGRYVADWKFDGTGSPIGASFVARDTLAVTGRLPGSARLSVSDIDGHRTALEVEVAPGANTVPDPISFAPRVDAAPGTVVDSPLAMVAGLTASAAVSVHGGEYSINGGPYTSQPGAVETGDWLGLRVIAPPAPGATTSAYVSVGGPITEFSVSTHAAAARPQAILLVPGWNLVGSGIDREMDSASAFGNAAQPIPGITAGIESVWSWNAATRKWRFFSPLLNIAQSAQYAAENGFEPLSVIAPGEGFWVHAYALVALAAQSGAGLAPDRVSFESLPRGWNLLSLGATLAPAEFNAAVGAAPAPGGMPIAFESLWAWNATEAKWVFYAPRLEALPGGAANVSDYATRHGHDAFAPGGRTLGPGVGFWVYRP